MPSMKQHALEYLAKGWSVFPIKAGGKEPLLSSWQQLQKRHPTVEQVEAWWSQWPDAGIAIVCGRISGLVVVDVDPRHGGKRDGLPDTALIAKTGGGGWHYFYQYPAHHQGRVPLQVNVDGTGMDVRADGGYVIAAPSLHASGERYGWAKHDLTSELAAPPDWALAPVVKAEPDAPSTEKWLTELLENGAPIGQRNSCMVRMGGYYAAKGLPMDAALALCQRWNNSLADPMSGNEVDVTVKSAYKMEARKKQRADKPFTGLNVLPLDEYMLKHGSGETEWTVQDWLPKATIAFVLSPPQTFKTWVIFDLACSVASGQPFLGKYTVHGPGPVILFQQEDAHMSIAQRTALIGTARLGREPPSMADDLITIPNITTADLPIYYHEERKLKFGNPEVMDALEDVIAKIKPKLVILDPLYSAADTDEYMAKAAQDMLRLKDLRDTYGCSFVIVHHTRKSMDSWDRQQLWGSQFINAYIETSWLMRKPPAAENCEAVVLRHTKSDGPLPFAHLTFDINTKETPWRYAVESHNIGEDRADEIIKGTLLKEDRPNLAEDQIMGLLLDQGPLDEKDIARFCSLPTAQVRSALRGLLQKHRVKQDSAGGWSLLDRAYK